MNTTINPIETLSPLQRSVLVIQELKVKLDQLEHQQTDPIALVGMGCRFPGGVVSPESFWQRLRAGDDAIQAVPQSRWSIETYYDPDPDAANKICAQQGGFLDAIDQFDADFFGLTPREAQSLDPQQRLLLEVSWEALEQSGIAPDSLVGSQSGVFIGMSVNEYAQHTLLGAAEIDAYTATGNALSVAAGRLSYSLGLQGPSLVVDTACSSSLVAVHLACQSLRARECRLALAGGVYLMLSPQTAIALSRLRALSPDGRCKTFDASADGYGRGEGCGVVVLKRLSDAIADGDPILAVIRGSAVNQDGRSSGLTVPNGLAQQAVIREALLKAQVEPAQVSYVETHGTGTPLGDPIEVNALGAVFGSGRSPRPLMLGSVKTTIGHLEAAAGIASLMKVVLALQHREIPPHLHLKQLNPHISLEASSIQIPTALTPWSGSPEQPRYAGVSSFGFSGTNAHLILEEALEPHVQRQDNGDRPFESDRPLHLLSLSAKRESDLQDLVERYVTYLQAHPEVAIADICFTANTGRSQFVHRLTFIADSTQALCQKLEQTTFKATQDSSRSNQAQHPEVQLVFGFTAQSTRVMSLGRQLYNTQPTFRDHLDRCNTLSRPYLTSSLLEIVDAQLSLPNAPDSVAFSSIAVFAITYALAQLWRSWGIEPVAVLGEGLGEYGAACVAGLFSVEDGIKLLVERERSLRHDIALNTAEAGVAPVASTVTYSRPAIQVLSSSTGHRIADTAIANAAYWCHPHRQSADWQISLPALINQGYTLMEMGADANLASVVKQYLPEQQGVYLPCLPQGDAAWQVLLQHLSTLYKQGVTVNWAGFDHGYPRCRVQLPTYPFKRQRYWIDAAKPQFHRISTPQTHPLLGERLRSPLPSIQFAAQHRLDTLPLITDHRLNGVPVMNLVLYLELALAGAMAARGNASQPHSMSVEDILIPAALVIPETGVRSLQLILNAEASDESNFQVFSLNDEPDDSDWTLHAIGKLCLEPALSSALDKISYTDIQARCTEEVGAEQFYQHMAQQGATLGTTCQMLERVWRRDGEALAKIRPSNHIENHPYYLPLGAIDACFQLLSAAPALDTTQSYMISSVEHFQFYGHCQAPLWSHVQLHLGSGHTDEQALRGDVILFTETGQRVAEATNVQLRPIPDNSLRLTAQSRRRASSRYQPPLLSRGELVAAQPEQRYGLLETYLLQCLSRSLQLPVDTLDTRQPLGGLIDSLMAFELRSRIEADLQVRVPMERFLGNGSIAQLAHLLLEQLSLANLIRSSAAMDESNTMEELVL
jgi:acyl transferase domain-containing protein/acyl carrier protein